MPPTLWPGLTAASLLLHLSSHTPMQKGRLQLSVRSKCTELFSEIFASLNHLSSQINYCVQMDFFALAPTLPLTSCIPFLYPTGCRNFCLSHEWHPSCHPGNTTYASLTPAGVNMDFGCICQSFCRAWLCRVSEPIFCKCTAFVLISHPPQNFAQAVPYSEMVGFVLELSVKSFLG